MGRTHPRRRHPARVGAIHAASEDHARSRHALSRRVLCRLLVGAAGHAAAARQRRERRGVERLDAVPGPPLPRHPARHARFRTVDADGARLQLVGGQADQRFHRPGGFAGAGLFPHRCGQGGLSAGAAPGRPLSRQGALPGGSGRHRLRRGLRRRPSGRVAGSYRKQGRGELGTLDHAGVDSAADATRR